MEKEIKKETSHVSLILGEVDESTSLTCPSQQREGKKKEEEKREGNVWERRERAYFFSRFWRWCAFCIGGLIRGSYKSGFLKFFPMVRLLAYIHFSFDLLPPNGQTVNIFIF